MKNLRYIGNNKTFPHAVNHYIDGVKNINLSLKNDAFDIIQNPSTPLKVGDKVDYFNRTYTIDMIKERRKAKGTWDNIDFVPEFCHIVVS